EVNPGFAAESVLAMRVAPGERFRSDQQSGAVLEQVLERIRALPEVKAAGSIYFLPLSRFALGHRLLACRPAAAASRRAERRADVRDRAGLLCGDGNPAA